MTNDQRSIHLYHAQLWSVVSFVNWITFISLRFERSNQSFDRSIEIHSLCSFWKSDKGKNWTWVNDEKVDHSLYPQTWKYKSFAWFNDEPYGDGPHCLVIQSGSSWGNNLWDSTRCTYMNYFICEVPKSVVIPTLDGPAGESLRMIEKSLEITKHFQQLLRACCSSPAWRNADKSIIQSTIGRSTWLP